MNNSGAADTEKKSPITTILIIAAIIAVVGGIYLMIGKSQASDPTITQAPPPGPNAQTLHPSAEKQRHKLPPRSPYGPAMQPVQAPQ